MPRDDGSGLPPPELSRLHFYKLPLDVDRSEVQSPAAVGPSDQSGRAMGNDVRDVRWAGPAQATRARWGRPLLLIQLILLVVVALIFTLFVVLPMASPR